MDTLRPTLTLRVGVTGHRTERLEDEAGIERAVAAALGDIAAACEACRASDARYQSAPPRLYVVSPLADGADMIAARNGLKAGYRLLTPLPFARDRVRASLPESARADFDHLLASADAVMEAQTDSRVDAEAGYVDAGLATLRHCDLLISIWDGEAARGPGGTAMITREAVRNAIPVIWIDARAPETVRWLRSDETEPFSRETAGAVVDTIVRGLPPPEDRTEPGDDAAPDGYTEFLAERESGFNFGIPYKVLDCLLLGRVQDLIRIPLFTPPSPALPRTASPGDRLLEVRFKHADQAAVHYANLYRSSYYSNYALSVLAVFLALLEVGVGFGKTLWIALETLTILAILFTTLRGRRGRWHEKWLDYRQLAEMLRRYHAVFLSGGSLGFRSNDLMFAPFSKADGWIGWYFNATVRELGMAPAAFSADLKRALLEDILETEIRPQIAYHRSNAARKHHLDHRLHSLGETAFFATLGVCLAYLALVLAAEQSWGGSAYDIKKAVKGWVTVLTGLLPALGAGAFGLRVQGELATLAERSTAMVAEFEAAEHRFSDLIGRPDPDLGDMRFAIEGVARIAMSENAEWKVVYQAKPLNLPA